MKMMRIGIVSCIVAALSPVGIQAQTILFVRGGKGTVGWMFNKDDNQAADITNASTNKGNCGWGTLATVLRDLGYTLEQMKEGDANGTIGSPLSFQTMELSKYTAIVLGSNNATYGTAAVDSVEAYVRNGGAVLFISDGNFGPHWAGAPTSDQYFLTRFGWTMNQDNGTYSVKRSDGDFLVPTHPILSGINEFDGEGVSPITLSSTTVPGVVSTILVRSKNSIKIKLNDKNPGPGTMRPFTANDAALIVASVGKGRIAGHVDRNTFFNLNGMGTSIKRFDNEAYARNLFTWLVGPKTSATPPLKVSANHQSRIAICSKGRIVFRRSGVYRLSIFSISGKKTWALPGRYHAEGGKINLTALRPGSYILSIQGENRDESHRSKIVVNGNNGNR